MLRSVKKNVNCLVRAIESMAVNEPPKMQVMACPVKPKPDRDGPAEQHFTASMELLVHCKQLYLLTLRRRRALGSDLHDH